MKQNLTLLTCILLLLGCQNKEETPPPIQKPTPETYLTQHQYQESAWAFRAQGDTTRADSVLTVLETVLKSQPDSLSEWAGKGITRPYIVFFPNNVWGLFKRAGSDTGGTVKNELASYRIDRLLEIDLMTMVVLRDITLPNGKTVSGSLSYFIQDAKLADKLGLRTTDQPAKLIFFDAVLANADRHTGNWMVHNKTGEVFAIDHNRTFYHDLGWTWWDRVQSISDPMSINTYHNRFKNLPDKTFKDALKNLITPEQYKNFHNARKTMIRYLDAKMK
jgi:hypothetical protein